MTYKLAHELKAAGFPQPEPKECQAWFFDTGVRSKQYIDFPELSVRNLLAFAPPLDDITPHLPTTFSLELWGGQPSCTTRDESTPIRTFGDTFAEAAARMYLEIKNPTI